MLHILATYAKREETLNRVMEFGGDGPVRAVARRARDAREHGDRVLGARRRHGGRRHDAALDRRAPPGRRPSTRCARRSCTPDPGAHYDGGVHRIDLATIQPMVATPGDPDRGIASDPKNGALVPEIGDVKIDIAYGGSCTAGKRDDVDMYARVMAEAERAGKRVARRREVLHPVRIAGGRGVREAARATLELFERTGVEVIKPGCGACIGCGPGVSERGDQVTVSAINRNYKGRSGPGKLYLASPLTVAASAVDGRDRRVPGRHVRAEEVSVVASSG